MTTKHQSSALVATVPDLAALLEPVKSDLEAVEQKLKSNLVDDSPFIEELLAQVFSAGGKRIRPALVLLSAYATRRESTRALVDSEFKRLQYLLAVLTELIHTASLVHDDVIDAASLRRGHQTVNRKWSDKLAVLIGDLLFAQASVCLARLENPRIVGIYGQVLGDLCAGEIRQMRQEFTTVVDWQTYTQKSIWKTASLFAAGTHSAPIINGATEEVVAAMKEYGLNLGVCFQVVDDLLDYTGSSSALGKKAGSDLAQGLVTAPAMFVLERNDTHARKLEELIKSRAVLSEDGLGEAVALVKNAGGVEATINLAQSYAAKARKAISILPVGPHKEALETLAEWLLTRTN